MKYVVSTKQTSLNVRAAPRLSASIMRVVERGEVVDVLPVPARNGWRELSTGGFVSSEFLSPVERRETAPLERLSTNRFPAFQSMWDNYPADHEPAAVKKAIGGKVDAGWIENTCTIRLSHAFNYSGQPIPPNHPGLNTVSGGDGKFYAFRVREMRRYIEAKYGEPKLHASGPEAFLAVTNKRGVIMFDVRGWRDATGHFDVWNGKAARHDAYFEKASAVLMWW
jgi:hypothetical protein